MFCIILNIIVVVLKIHKRNEILSRYKDYEQHFKLLFIFLCFCLVLFLYFHFFFLFFFRLLFWVCVWIQFSFCFFLLSDLRIRFSLPYPIKNLLIFVTLILFLLSSSFSFNLFWTKENGNCYLLSKLWLNDLPEENAKGEWCGRADMKLFQ